MHAYVLTMCAHDFQTLTRVFFREMYVQTSMEHFQPSKQIHLERELFVRNYRFSFSLLIMFVLKTLTITNLYNSYRFIYLRYDMFTYLIKFS